jgi:predicted nucleic acid-binding protein
MGKRYLIDSNTLIEYVGKLLPGPAHTAVSAIVDEEFNISFINKIEVLGHSLADNKLRAFIDLASVYDINNDIIEQTIDLRKEFKIKIPDAIVAATALIYNLTLVTRNIIDFKNIPGLDLLNHWDTQ